MTRLEERLQGNGDVVQNVEASAMEGYKKYEKWLRLVTEMEDEPVDVARKKIEEILESMTVDEITFEATALIAMATNAESFAQTFLDFIGTKYNRVLIPRIMGSSRKPTR